jgi:hypothetical protein
MTRLALLMAVAAVVLAVAAPAYGQGAVGDAYGGQGGQALPTIEEGGNAGTVETQPTATTEPTQVTATTSSDSALPFTGLDLGLLVVGGLALVCVGVGLRRFARPLS